jgi:hypothetical protein
MQVKLKFSLVLFLTACLAGLNANAQDEGQSLQEVQELNQHHPELNLNDDKTLLMDADAKAPKNQSQSNTHDAGNSGNANKNKSDGSTKPSPNDKTEEDPLSFNFIYFIIQKFKISDIVDD